MRSHRAILRLIAENSLDPKIPYVSGKNGTLVPKDTKSKSAPVIEQELDNKTEDKVDEPSKVEIPVDLPAEVTLPETVPEELVPFEDVKLSDEVTLIVSKTGPSILNINTESEDVVPPPAVETKKKLPLALKKKKVTE